MKTESSVQWSEISLRKQKPDICFPLSIPISDYCLQISFETGHWKLIETSRNS